MSSDNQDWSGFEIAIIGMAGRFPGASNLDEYWKNLKQGVESIRFFTKEELALKGVPAESLNDKGFVRAHGVLDDMELFDSAFFGFSPREAEIMDPQHRLFLETVWEAIEHAGYNPDNYRGMIGVYAGASVDDYLHANVMQNSSIREAVTAIQAGYSNYSDFLATRVSYKLGLRGPSFAVQSACSTSLVAVNLACQQLLSGACDIAVAGGASITLPQNWGYKYQEGMIMSPDGHCRTFDADARGCLKGDGVGVVVMKRLADAIEDGDTIDAVILGSATNNDGDSKVGYTAPGIEGQIDVIRSAQIMAGVDAESISYVEAHGTGTPMGDPVEVSALTQVFREGTERKQFCGLGSVKSNFGHLDAAAGIAGLIKLVLSLKHKTLPPSLHYKRPNPQVDFASSPFYVNDVCRDWQTAGSPRRAGISSFGIGGTNAHMVLEEAPELENFSGRDNASYNLFPLAARSTTALGEMASALKCRLKDQPELRLPDIAFTLQQGRKAFDYRRVVIARTGEEFIAGLDEQSATGSTAQVLSKPYNVIFLFTGQGSQYIDMARGLYEENNDFRKDIDQCAEILLLYLKEDIRKYIYVEDGGNEEQLRKRLTDTDVAQPALFVIEYSLARYWMRMGIEPSALIGHSLGEIVATCIAGVFSLEDALRLIALRGRLMQSMPSGTMMAVPLTPEAISPYLNSELSLAAINAPSLCVVSGPKEAVEQLQARVQSEHDLDCRQLHTSHAFHSYMMDPVIEPFRAALKACGFNPAQIPVISTITGQPLSQLEAQDSEYWIRNIRDTVQFSKAVGQVVNRENSVLLEIGPGNTLISLAKKHPDKTGDVRFITSLRHPHMQIDDTAHILNSLGQCWSAGLEVNWDNLNQGEQRQRVHLPSYPFERKRHWIEPDADTPATSKRAVQFKGKEVTDWFYAPSWKRSALPVHSEDVNEQPSNWLIFMDESGVAEQFIGQIQNKDPSSDITCIQFGKSYSRIAERAFTIRPDEPGDILEVIAYLVNKGRRPNRILHFALLFGDGNDEFSSTSVEKAELIQTYGFFPLLYLAGALFQYDLGHPVSLSVIADQSQAVTGDEVICPDKITTQAIALVLPTESDSFKARFVDVLRDSVTGLLSNRDVNGLYSEILTNKDDAVVVAYRYGVRWVNHFEKRCLGKVDSVPGRLRQKGVYLITGGLGGLGLSIAGYLAETLRARLVLVGREGLPFRSEWPSLITVRGESDPQIKKIRAIEALEQQGAQVQVHAADVADEDAMAKIIGQANQTFGEINGVIHAAGIPGGGIIAMQNKQTVERVWSAKIGGTKVLLNQFRDANPDFILLCSSLNAVIGRPGRVEYTAANLYLDAVAQQQFVNQGLPVFSINWDTWGEVGMAVNIDSPSSEHGPEENPRILPVDGIEVFKRVIDQDSPQVLVYTGLWTQYDPVEIIDTVAIQHIEEEDHTPATHEENIDESADAITHFDDDPQTETEIKLSQIWKALLGIKRVGVNDNFFELGGDSVVSIQLVARSKQAGIQLTTKQIFECQTIAELAKVTGQTQTVSSEENLVIVGQAPLTPIQAWFFEQDFSSINHWNLAQWVELPDNIDERCIQEAISSIMLHHDALRMRFNFASTGWIQEMMPITDCEPGCDTVCDAVLIQKDLSQFSEDELSIQLSSEVLAAQSSLDIKNGSLARFVLLKMPAPAAPRLLMVVHHLVVDLISIQIIIDDIKTAYNQVSNKQSINLPAKSSSYKRWAESLVSYVQTAEVQSQLQYWLDKSAQTIAPLPRDMSSGINSISSSQLMKRALSIAETQLILDSVSKEESIQMRDILLAALASTLTAWTGSDSVCVDMEGHGRDPVNETIDVSRTVGWFTSIYPLIFQKPATSDPISWTTQTAKQLNNLPNKGFDYSVLRYCHPDASVRDSLKKGLVADIVFLYQGQVHESEEKSNAWQTGAEMPESMRQKDQHRLHLLDFHVLITSGKLVVNVGYSDAIHKNETISRILDSYMENVKAFAIAFDHGFSQYVETEIDLSLVDLNETDLIQLENLLNA